MKTLTVLVPFYNEENTILKSIEKLDSLTFINEVILLNDGSTDNSLDMVNKFIKNKRKYKILSYKENIGKGAVLNKSREHISNDYVVIHDADLEYYPKDLIEMFKFADGSNLVLGSRFIGKKQRSNIYFRTYIANKVISLFFSLLNQKRITDVATCYKLMPTSFFKQNNFKEKGFSIEIELISKFLKNNKNIIEVPISYNARSYEEGKKIKTKDGFFYLFNTLRYRFFN